MTTTQNFNNALLLQMVCQHWEDDAKLLANISAREIENIMTDYAKLRLEKGIDDVEIAHSENEKSAWVISEQTYGDFDIATESPVTVLNNATKKQAKNYCDALEEANDTCFSYKKVRTVEFL